MLRNFAAHVTGLTRLAVAAHLDWIYRITLARPLRVIGCALLVMVLAVISIRTVHFETDIFKLFPSRQGPLKLFLDSLQWSGGGGDAYFLLEGDERQLVPEAEAFAARLKALTVDGSPAFRKVSYRVYDPAEAEAFADFTGYAAGRPDAFLAPDDAAAFAAKLTPGAMDRSLRRAGTELASQAGMGMRDIIAADPLYLRELVLPRLKGAAQAFDLDPDSPYFISRDGRLLIMVAEPAQPVRDLDFARKLVKGINGARDGFSSQISCAGAHLSAVIDEEVMKRNIIACVVSSLFVVLGLFYLTYRRFLPTLLIPFIILYGTVLALGGAGIFLASVNVISLAFTALIVGLGTDYSIHLYDRFYHERSKGKSAEEALRPAIVDTGHGLFTAAVTTALPFLALTVSDVRALFELGLLVGLGVIFSLYATFFFLPPLLLFGERRFPCRRYQPLSGFSLGSVWSFTGRHCRKVAFFSVVLIAGLFAASFFVSFEGELKNLQPQHSEAFLTQEKIERHLSHGRKQLLLAVDGTSLDDVMRRGERVASIADKYQRNGELKAWSSLVRIVNDRETAKLVREKLARAIGAADPAADLREALDNNGFDAGQFSPALEGISRLKSGAPYSPEDAIRQLGQSPLRGVVERHLVKEGDGYHLLFYLHYEGREFRQDAFLAELAALDPDIRATSVDLVGRQLAGSVKTSFLQGFAIGGVLVLFLLLAHFRNVSGILHSLVPVIAGVIAMLGLMALTGMRLNFMNSMVLVTILGMGSDYGLHISHRVEGAGEGGAEAEYVQSGRAVLLSALTTIAGFGSLAFTDYGAMASIGWATNFGIVATALFALVSLPAFMRLSSPRREYRQL